MYKSITIRNFRALTELQVDNLGPINLFVGRNNCGKTTFLEGVFLLVGGTNPRLPININGFRGLSFIIPDYWPTFFHNMQVSVPIEIQGQSQDGLSFQTPLTPKTGETHSTDGTGGGCRHRCDVCLKREKWRNDWIGVAVPNGFA
jgi:hypothetical protein